MTLADFRDLSIILLAVEAFIIGFVPIALFLALGKGVFEINHRIKNAGSVVQSYFRRAERSTKVAGERIAAPFITAGATTARIKRWQHTLVSAILPKNEV